MSKTIALSQDFYRRDFAQIKYLKSLYMSDDMMSWKNRNLLPIFLIFNRLLLLKYSCMAEGVLVLSCVLFPSIVIRSFGLPSSIYTYSCQLWQTILQVDRGNFNLSWPFQISVYLTFKSVKKWGSYKNWWTFTFL